MIPDASDVFTNITKPPPDRSASSSLAMRPAGEWAIESAMKQSLAIESIIIDKDIQPRVKGLDEDHVDDLFEALDRPDADIPPPRVFVVPGRGNILTRGFHRIAAMKKKGRKKVECEIRHGTYAEADIDSASSNTDHGLKRSNADKRNAVSKFLKYHSDWSDRKIAEAAAVSANFVGELRDQLSSDDSSPPQKRIGMDNKARVLPTKKPDDNTLTKVPETIVAPTVGKLETYYRNDGIPDIPGVYRPKMMKTSSGQEVVLDAFDNPAPPAIGDTFADPKLRDLLAQVLAGGEVFEAAYKAFIELKAGRKVHQNYPWLDIPTVEKQIILIRNAGIEFANELRAGIPYAVCPGCSGQRTGCKECRLCGYWPKTECEAQPKRFRKVGA